MLSSDVFCVSRLDGTTQLFVGVRRYRSRSRMFKIKTLLLMKTDRIQLDLKVSYLNFMSLLRFFVK